MSKEDIKNIMSLLNYLKASTKEWENLQSYYQTTYPNLGRNVYQDYCELIIDNGLIKEMSEENHYFVHITQKGKNVNEKDIKRFVNDAKGKRTFRQKHPFVYDANSRY
ncbi:MAG: hypothetical protein IPL50_07685 [Chitinophagaceae bacterium]|nr:hypothetical protein [Chitinophagaceae bacterium]